MITRTERIDLKLFFDTDKLSDKDIKRIKEFHSNPLIGRGDYVTSDLWFNIDYYDNVEKQMQFCIDMIDKSKIVKANLEELKYGRSIFCEMLHKLDSIIDYVENNK